MNHLLSSTAVEKLEILIEEATRSTDEGVKRFIEPAQGTLRGIGVGIALVGSSDQLGNLVRRPGSELEDIDRPISSRLKRISAVSR
jgi:hypothetical protein